MNPDMLEMQGKITFILQDKSIYQSEPGTGEHVTTSVLGSSSLY